MVTGSVVVVGFVVVTRFVVVVALVVLVRLVDGAVFDGALVDDSAVDEVAATEESVVRSSGEDEVGADEVVLIDGLVVDEVAVVGDVAARDELGPSGTPDSFPSMTRTSAGPAAVDCALGVSGSSPTAATRVIDTSGNDCASSEDPQPAATSITETVTQRTAWKRMISRQVDTSRP